LINKREQDGYQKQLLNALNKYAPPAENQYGERKLPSRGGVNMNIYEKAFFDNGGKDMLINGKSLKADSALVPIDHNHGITNYFNKNTNKTQEETYKDKGEIPILERTPEILKQTEGYGFSLDKSYGSPEIPTINTNIKKQINKNRLKYEYGSISDDKETIKDDDTIDFINKINGVGRNQNDKQFGRQNSLAKKAKEMKSNKLNDSYTVSSKNLAEKLDFDAFPALPDYEGIQSKFLENSSKTKKSNEMNIVKAEPLNTSILSDTNNGIKFANYIGGEKGGIRDSTISIGNGTVNTLNTLNSINLEKINNRNEKRLNNFEHGYGVDALDDDHGKPDRSFYHIMKKNSNDYGNQAIKLDTKLNFMSDGELNEIKEENWEETLQKNFVGESKFL